MFEKRKQLRLKDYDYAQEGAYFVTICTQDRKKRFEDNSPLEDIVRTEWLKLSDAFPNIFLNEFIVMPDHIHGIIFIERRGLIHQAQNTSKVVMNQGVMNHAPTGQWGLMRNRDVTLGKIVRHFKAKCAKLIHDQGCVDFQWQRGYYDRIIRNDRDLHEIQRYIVDNPIKSTV